MRDHVSLFLTFDCMDDLLNFKKLRRENPVTFLLNELELAALRKYCKKYHINRSRFMRETVIRAIIKRFEDDYPTLFPIEPYTIAKDVEDAKQRLKNNNLEAQIIILTQKEKLPFDKF